jgi:regulator of ribonuclease activity A
MAPPFKTCDLADAHPDDVLPATPIFRDFGGASAFSGIITTVRVHDDNVLVRKALEEPSQGRVLVVDGGASLKSALMGDVLGAIALKNGWSGVVINGCVRDTTELAKLAVGIKALAAYPIKSVKRGLGDRDVVVTFAGCTFRPGEWIYADPDGILVAKTAL